MDYTITEFIEKLGDKYGLHSRLYVWQCCRGEQIGREGKWTAKLPDGLEAFRNGRNWRIRETGAPKPGSPEELRDQWWQIACQLEKASSVEEKRPARDLPKPDGVPQLLELLGFFYTMALDGHKEEIGVVFERSGRVHLRLPRKYGWMLLEAEEKRIAASLMTLWEKSLVALKALYGAPELESLKFVNTRLCLNCGRAFKSKPGSKQPALFCQENRTPCNAMYRHWIEKLEAQESKRRRQAILWKHYQDIAQKHVHAFLKSRYGRLAASNLQFQHQEEVAEAP